MSTQYKEVIDCLKHLIDTQEFIVIPDFGALVMQMESAEFSFSQNVVFPPRKKVLFNPLLKHNDGLLISEVQKKLNIDFVLSQTLVHQFVQSIKVLLDTKRRVDVEDIGFFYKDIHDNILFESSLNAFYLSESFGLYPVPAVVIEKEPTAFQSKGKNEKRIVQFDTRNLYRAAVVFLIAGLLFVYWWVSPFDFKFDLANIASHPAKNKIQVSGFVYPVVKIRYNDFYFNKKSDKIVENSGKSGNNKNSVFSIVAGCFRVEENAKKLFNEFKSKGIEASVKWNAEKQLYVVSIGDFNDKLKASASLKDLKTKGILKDAWIKEQN